MVICRERGADLHMAQLMPLPLTVSRFSKIQIGFYRAILCIRGTSHGPVSVCVCLCLSVTSRSSTRTAKRRITQTTPRDTPGTLVFLCQRYPRNSTMQSLSLVMSECFVSGRGQGHVSNFCIVDLETFVTASRRYTGDIHNSTVCLWHPRQWEPTRSRHGWVHIVRDTLPPTKPPTSSHQFGQDLSYKYFCTVAWQLAKLLLTRRITPSLGDSWASCTFLVSVHPGSPGKRAVKRVCVYCQ